MKQSNGCKNLLIGCGGLTAVVSLILMIIAALNWSNISDITAVMLDFIAEPEYVEGLNDSEEVLTYLQEHTDDFSLVVYTVGPDGVAIDPETQVWHNPDQLMPLASTKKILILAAYAQAVAAGEIDPKTEVPIADWDHYHLPGVNGGAHIHALSDLQIETDEKGYALDPTATVTLDDIAFAMINSSDNAAPDFLLDLLGADAVEQMMLTAGLTPEPILPFAGMILTWQNSESPRLTKDALAELTALDRDAYVDLVWETQEKFINEPWGIAERDWWRHEKSTSNPHRLEMIAANQLDGQGTARTFAQIMAGVVTNTFVSAEVSTIMQQHLSWPMEFPGNQANFETLGSKGGSLAGLLTGATYYVPLNGDFEDQPRVAVLFMRDMPFAAWIRLSETFAQQMFERDLAIDATFVNEVQAAFSTQ